MGTMCELTDHETKVKQAVVIQVVQLAALLAQQHAGDHGGARRSQAPPQGDGVLDVHVGLDGEGPLVVAPQHVEGDAGDEVDLGVEADVARVLAFPLVRHPAVERFGRRCLAPVDRDVQLQVHGQCETDYIEAGANVGAGAWGFDYEGFSW